MDLPALLRPLLALAIDLAVCSVVFGLLALALKGARALADGRAAAPDVRINLIVMAVDRVAITPLLSAAFVGAAVLVRQGGWPGVGSALAALGAPATLFLAVAAGDFLGYWRHRAQHWRWLWPAHAVHHSDRQLSWLSLERMHPVDRLGTAVDTLVLAAMGFPAWALFANLMVRHYYGFLIHADVPWTWGKASWVLISPAAHRWHHAREITTGCNFATVFSLWDRAFGTYHQPGPCEAPLGVDEDLGRGALGQYLHPFRAWREAAAQRRSATA